MKKRIQALLAALKARVFAVQLVLVAGAIAGGGVWLGAKARGQAEALESEALRLERIITAAERWDGEFRPPSPAESLAWQATRGAMSDLGIRDGDRLFLAQALARHLEGLGARSVRVTFAPSDSVASPPPRELAEWSYEIAPYVLVVQFVGGIDAALAHIGRLPPPVSPWRVLLRRTEEGAVAARVELIVYEPAGSSGRQEGVREAGPGRARGVSRRGGTAG